MECLSKPAHTEDVDANLIKDLRSSGINKAKAEDQFFRRYSYLIHTGENKYSLCTEDLFDAYSDAILAVIFSIRNESFQSRSSLKTYVFGIFHHKCVDIIRNRAAHKNTVHKTQPLDDMHAHLTDNSLSVVEKMVKQSDFEIIKEKINYLGKNSKQVLLMSADGYSDKEIAASIKFKNANVVKTCRIRALKKLRLLVY